MRGDMAMWKKAAVIVMCLAFGSDRYVPGISAFNDRLRRLRQRKQ